LRHRGGIISPSTRNSFDVGNISPLHRKGSFTKKKSAPRKLGDVVPFIRKGYPLGAEKEKKNAERNFI